MAVVSAKVKRDDGGGAAGGGAAKSGVSLSIDKAAQLYKLGTAADFARCKADRKDGRPCSMAVNKSVSEYCCFHAAAAIKALQTGRVELGGGGCVRRTAPRPHSWRGPDALRARPGLCRSRCGARLRCRAAARAGQAGWVRPACRACSARCRPRRRATRRRRR